MAQKSGENGHFKPPFRQVFRRFLGNWMYRNYSNNEYRRHSRHWCHWCLTVCLGQSLIPFTMSMCVTLISRGLFTAWHHWMSALCHWSGILVDSNCSLLPCSVTALSSTSRYNSTSVLGLLLSIHQLHSCYLYLKHKLSQKRETPKIQFSFQQWKKVN